MGHPREQSAYTASLGLYKLMWQNCFSRPIGCTGDTGKASMKSIVFIKSIAHFGTQCLLSQYNIQCASLVSIYDQKARLAYIFSFSARNMKGKPSSTSATVCLGRKGRHFWPWPCRSHPTAGHSAPSFPLKTSHFPASPKLKHWCCFVLLLLQKTWDTNEFIIYVSVDQRLLSLWAK